MFIAIASPGLEQNNFGRILVPVPWFTRHRPSLSLSVFNIFGSESMAAAAMKVGERKKKKVIIDTDPGIGPYLLSILLVGFLDRVSDRNRID